MKNVASRTKRRNNRKVARTRSLVSLLALGLSVASIGVLNSLANTDLGIAVKLFPVVICTLSATVAVAAMK